MGDRADTRFEFRTTCFDIMIKYHLSKKVKLLKNDKFNYLIAILKVSISAMALS